MPNDKADTAKVMREAIATRVRGAVAEARKTQREVGDAVGIPQSSVSLKMNGERAWRAEELAALAGFLAVPIERLMPIVEPAASAS